MTSSPNEKLHPAQNPEVWDLEMVVATTWAVITACGWTPVTSSSIDRPGTRFLVRNALIGGPSFHQHQEAINAQMADARCRAQALIPAMRRSLHPASTIGRRLLLVIRDGRVHPSDLALPVTAVANQMRRGNVRGLIGPSDKARSARLPYDLAIGERIAVTGVAVKVRPIRGFSRSDGVNAASDRVPDQFGEPVCLPERVQHDAGSVLGAARSDGEQEIVGLGERH